MNISRRKFMRGVIGSVSTLWALQPKWTNTTLGRQPERELDCILLDVNSDCVLRESLHGYQATLGKEYTLIQPAGLHSQRGCRTVIVPGFGVMNPAVASTLADFLIAGSHIVLESGAGFLGPAEFAGHQRILDHYFNIAVGAPVDVWAASAADNALPTHRHGRHPIKELNNGKSIPYVKYHWPQAVTVRDFSRVIPVSANVRDVIADVGALPVALKRRIGKGTLIFLGSPLGPALGAGDLEALSWLRLVTALWP